MVSNFPTKEGQPSQTQPQAVDTTEITESNGYNRGNPYSVRYASLRQQNRRWTGIFDNEARASRMSFIAADTLLPRAELEKEHRRWAGMALNWRETWFSQIVGDEDMNEKIWSGEFDVERRASWQSRNSSRSSVWSDDSTLKKLGSRDTCRDTLGEDRIAQIDGQLITREILKYDFDGTGADDDPHLVTWIENDSSNPLNFSAGRKWTNSLLLAFACFIVSVASSGLSQGTEDLKRDFGIGQVTALLATSTFALGFAVGALILSPLSEVFGRRELCYITFGTFVGLTGITIFVPSMMAVIILRFFSGIAGSFTQSVSPAIVADIFNAQERGLVLSIFTLSGLMGHVLGPIMCGFLAAAHGWRSIVIFITAVGLPLLILIVLTLPETYAPVLLQRRATKLNLIFGRRHIVAGIAPKSMATQLRVGALRPWIMLVFEPIVTLLSIFLGIVQGTLFLLFAAYPIVFQQVRGWPQGFASLPFLALAVGIIFSLLYVAFIDQERYNRVVSKNRHSNVPPEARLPPAILGAVLLPIGLFWFAWTNGPEMFWLISVSAGTFFGFGMVSVYMSITNYLVDAYLGYAASALAASTVLRSVASAVFPLFTNRLYDSLGIHWASSVPAFLAIMFIPFLVGIYKWGHAIRKKTRFGQEAAKMAEMSK